MLRLHFFVATPAESERSRSGVPFGLSPAPPFTYSCTSPSRRERAGLGPPMEVPASAVESVANYVGPDSTTRINISFNSFLATLFDSWTSYAGLRHPRVGTTLSCGLASYGLTAQYCAIPTVVVSPNRDSTKKHVFGHTEPG